MITVKLNFKTCLESSFDFAILFAGFISIKVRYNFKINPQKLTRSVTKIAVKWHLLTECL